MVGRRRTPQHTDFYGNFWQGSPQKQFSVRQTAFLQISFPTNESKINQEPLYPPPPHPNNPTTTKHHPLLLQWFGSPSTHQELNYSAFWPQIQPWGPSWSLSVWDWEFEWKSQQPPTGHRAWLRSHVQKTHRKNMGWPGQTEQQLSREKTKHFPISPSC